MELLEIHGKETHFNKHGPNLSQTICSHNPVEMEIIRKTKTKTKKSPEAEYRSNQTHLVFGNFFAHFLQDLSCCVQILHVLKHFPLECHTCLHFFGDGLAEFTL